MQNEKASHNSSRFYTVGAHVWAFLVDQWFFLVLLLLIVVSSQVQVPLSDLDLKERVVEHLSVAVIFFINGCTVETRTLMDSAQSWRAHIFIQGMSFFVTSATMLGIVTAAATNRAFMDPALLNGLVVLGCLPTAFSFNTIMTGKANGNTALTLAESVVGNTLGPFVSTLLVQLYLSSDAWYARALEKNVDGYAEIFRKVFQQFGLTLFLPLVIGQATLHLFPNATRKAMNGWNLKKLASVALLVLIWSAYDSAFATGSFASISATHIMFLVFLLIGLFIVWMLMALVLALWLPREDVIAAAFCIPAKSPALGMPLAAVIFTGISDEQVAKICIPLVFYQCIQMCLSSLATIPLRRWQARLPEKEYASSTNSTADLTPPV